MACFDKYRHMLTQIEVSLYMLAFAYIMGFEAYSQLNVKPWRFNLKQRDASAVHQLNCLVARFCEY